MLLIIILLLLDQLSKYLFTTITNTGAAFGILKGYTTLLIIISLLALTACVYYYVKYKNKKIRFALSFLIAGIIWNLIDRIIFGYVRDFIDFKIWPVFNLADSFNVIGVILLIYISFKKK